MPLRRGLVDGAVLVAGAGPGVSGHLARLLAGEGRPVGLLGSDEPALLRLRDELAAGAAATCEALTVDLTDDAATRAAVGDLGDRLGPWALVHYNPSAYREADPLVLTPDQLAADVALGVGGLLSVVQAARASLVRGSRVSVTGSMAADEPWHVASSLGVQKAGVRNLVLSLDAALSPDGVRAVSVTVRGTLATDGPFSHGRVAQALREAVDQPEEQWRAEVTYAG